MPVFGTVISYDENQNIKIGKLEKLFESFEYFFKDFIELRNNVNKNRR